MAGSNAVLILGEGNNSTNVADLMHTLGLIPLMRDEMEAALDVLRHDEFAAVFVDGESINADSIEFVLNVRDIDSEIPMIIIDQHLTPPEHAVLEQQHDTYLLPDTTDVATLLEHIL
jgi:two-component SAPR family response regulator